MSESVRIFPIGGMGNVTKNMFLYEYGEEILIVDCGIGFPEQNMFGVDVMIPDISYLENKTDRIVGMVLTHAHDDHIAGLPYILPQIGTHFPIYGSKLTIGFAEDRVREFGLSPDFREFPQRPLELGSFTVRSIEMTHSVPGTRHLSITTPAGTIYHGTDFKFDLTPVDGIMPDFQSIANQGYHGVLALLSDSLNSEVQEFSQSESSLTDMFEREIRDAKGKFVVTIMSSNIHRIQQIVNVAASHNRKVAFMGRSIEQNVKTATRLGFLKLPKNVVINRKQIEKLPPKQVCVVIAGSQGQEGSSLSRAALGEHNQISINPEDKVLFSSSAIPGNEANVYDTIDSLSKTGADVVYNDLDDRVHTSGHSSAIEQKLLIALTKPKHLVPIGGTFHHMIQYRRLARQMGYEDKNIHLLDEGEIIEFSQDKTQVVDKVKLKTVLVDGLGIGDVGDIILSDRRRMAEEGVLIIITPISPITQGLMGDIQVISRGFVFMRDAAELMDVIRDEVTQIMEQQSISSDWNETRRSIEKRLQKMLYKEIGREPLILPIRVEV